MLTTVMHTGEKGTFLIHIYVCLVNKIQIYKSSVKSWLNNARQSNKNLKVKNPSKGIENKMENVITQLCTCILNISCAALTSLSLIKQISSWGSSRGPER